MTTPPHSPHAIDIPRKSPRVTLDVAPGSLQISSECHGGPEGVRADTGQIRASKVQELDQSRFLHAQLVLGIDPSKQTGLALFNGVTGCLGKTWALKVASANYTGQRAMGDLVRDAARQIRKDYPGIRHAAIETPMGSTRTHKSQDRLIGRIESALEQDGWHVIEVAPSTAKKALTGNGNASKEDMVRTAMERYGKPHENDPVWSKQAIADAIGIALAGWGVVK